MRDLFAAKSFIANQAEIFFQVFNLRRFSESSLRDSFFKRLSARGDRRQGIVDFMDDAGSQATNRGELLSARDGAFRFHSGGNVLADRYDVDTSSVTRRALESC